VFIIVQAGPAFGQDESAAYRVGPGDVVDIQVWREPDLSGAYRIGPDGFLRHVLAGAIPASGSDIESLTARLRESLERDYLREARLSITLVESARHKVSALGGIARPGAYPLRHEMRVLDLIFAAGGLSENATDSATLLRRIASQGEATSEPDLAQASQQEFAIDLAALINGGDLSQNLFLTPGDVLLVASRESAVSAAPPEGRVRVVGEVQRPGSYPLSDAPTVLDALLAAGGLSEYAAGNRGRLVRGEGSSRVETRIRLQDVAEGREDVTNVELQDGDIIVVPESFF
jgi:polysaccharide export outer membrane protein